MQHHILIADRVFGPATTTRHVYDVAAQHVVNGAMEGVNGKFSFSLLDIFQLKHWFLYTQRLEHQHRNKIL